MAELLVFAQDQIGADIYKDTKRYKRGDVVVVCEDGWNWGIEELKNPLFRIISIPGMSVSEASQFLAPEVDTDPLNPSKTLKRRAFKLDVDALGKGVTDWFADEKRSVEKVQAADVGLSKADLIAVKVEKGKTTDPAIIGDVEAVIG
jgi:hypothetical protein